MTTAMVPRCVRHFLHACAPARRSAPARPPRARAGRGRRAGAVRLRAPADVVRRSLRARHRVGLSARRQRRAVDAPRAQPLDGGGMAPEAVEVRWEVAARRGVPRRRRAAATAIARRRATAQRPRRARRASSPRAGTATASRRAARRSPVGPHAHRARAGPRRRAPARSPSPPASTTSRAISRRYRHLADEDLDLVVVPRRLHLRERAGAATTCASTSAPASARTLADYRDRYAQYKSDADLQPRPRRRAVDRHLGRPRGRQRLRRRPLRGPVDPRSSRAAPPPTRRSASTCRCRARCAARRGACASTTATTGARSRASTCSTTASTARYQACPPPRPRRLDDRRGRRLPRARCDPTARCSARRRSAGSTRASRSATRAGTSSRSRR